MCMRAGLEAFGVGGEAVVLAGDLDALGGDVQDGVVGAAVPELELVGPGAQGEGQELVPEADPEGWDASLALEKQGPEGADGVLDSGGVARSVGDEQAVGLA